MTHTKKMEHDLRARLQESIETHEGSRMRADARFRLLRTSANATCWTPELKLKAATFGYLYTMPVMKRVVVQALGMLHPDDVSAVTHMIKLGDVMDSDHWRLDGLATEEDWMEWMESV